MVVMKIIQINPNLFTENEYFRFACARQESTQAISGNNQQNDCDKMGKKYINHY